jgi:hypothetical protein
VAVGAVISSSGATWGGSDAVGVFLGAGDCSTVGVGMSGAEGDVATWHASRPIIEEMHTTTIARCFSVRFPSLIFPPNLQSLASNA